MQKFSLDYVRCVKCGKNLKLESLYENNEVIEGFLNCTHCKIKYPIICKIPILWGNFAEFLSNRARLGGELILSAKTPEMKKFVKKSLSKNKKTDDITWIEKKWASIYLNSKKTKFYTEIKKSLDKLPRSQIVLEHGCSVGHICEYLAKKSHIVFGIDSSFYAIKIAKKIGIQNADFFVADSLFHPFGRQNFDLVVGLNLLEIIEPKEFIKTVSKQIKSGTLLLSDPYDFERGKRTVRNPVDSKTIREELQKHGFRISKNTKNPSFIAWNLIINARTKLHYKVDLILGKKQKDL